MDYTFEKIAAVVFFLPQVWLRLLLKAVVTAKSYREYYAYFVLQPVYASVLLLIFCFYLSKQITCL